MIIKRIIYFHLAPVQIIIPDDQSKPVEETVSSNYSFLMEFYINVLRQTLTSN